MQAARATWIAKRAAKPERMGLIMTVPAQFVMSQDFSWHDASGHGEYRYGEDGYLVMDGSKGTIRCSRYLKEKITSRSGAVEVKMRVVFGKPYHICLYDEADRLVADCLIDGDGWIKFRRGDEYVSSGEYATYAHGRPSVDPEFSRPWWYAVESDEVTYNFGDFDFGRGSFAFTVTKPFMKGKVTMDGCVLTHASSVCKLELQTGGVEPGTRIRLRHYSQYEKGTLIYHEAFPHHWKPIPAPADGYPHDNICETRLRPVGNQWLETCTFYGWVQAEMPFLPEGELEFQMMTPDVATETCLQLEQYGSDIHFGCPINVAIMKGKFCCTIPAKKRSRLLKRDFDAADWFYLDQPSPMPDQEHRIKIAWFRSGHFRLRIDGTPAKVNDSYDIPVVRTGDFRGIDTLYLHPGNAAIRPTLAQKKQGKRFPEGARPHLTYWGSFRVKPI